MKKIFLLALITLAITGCYSLKTIDEVAKNKYVNENKPPVINDNFIITNQFNNDSLIKTKKSHYYFIPALFYWGNSKTLISELNSNIPINLLNKYANEYADSIGFKNKLLNKKIYINIKTVPKKIISKFTYSLIIAGAPGYYGGGIDINRFKIISDNSNLEIEYTIKENEKILENDILILNNTDFSGPDSIYTNYIKDPREIKGGKFDGNGYTTTSETEFINEYLKVYDLHIKMLSKILIDKLKEKL